MTGKLRDLIENKDLKERLRNIEKIMRDDYLPYWQVHAPHYTDHSEHHYRAVEKNLDEMIPHNIKKKLEGYEIFLLLCGVWIHDIGIMYKRDPSEKDEEIRENHHERGRELIRNELKELQLDDKERFVVGELTYAHRDIIKISEIEESITLRHTELGNVDIRVSLLASLIRLADACDVSQTRTSEKTTNISKLPSNAQIYHEIHSRVSGVDFNFKEKTIVINATIQSEEDAKIIRRAIVESITKELNSVKSVLKHFLPYMDVELGQVIDAYSPKLDVPPAFLKKFEKHLTCDVCDRDSIHKDFEDRIPFEERMTGKQKITIIGDKNFEELQKIFRPRWIQTFDVVKIREFDDIVENLEKGEPVIVNGARDSGKTSLVYKITEEFLNKGWNIAVHEPGKILERSYFEAYKPLLVVIDGLERLDDNDQLETFSFYNEGRKCDKCAFLMASYRGRKTNLKAMD